MYLQMRNKSGARNDFASFGKKNIHYKRSDVEVQNLCCRAEVTFFLYPPQMLAAFKQCQSFC